MVLIFLLPCTITAQILAIFFIKCTQAVGVLSGPRSNFIFIHAESKEITGQKGKESNCLTWLIHFYSGPKFLIKNSPKDSKSHLSFSSSSTSFLGRAREVNRLEVPRRFRIENEPLKVFRFRLRGFPLRSFGSTYGIVDKGGKTLWIIRLINNFNSKHGNLRYKKK